MDEKKVGTYAIEVVATLTNTSAVTNYLTESNYSTVFKIKIVVEPCSVTVKPPPNLGTIPYNLYFDKQPVLASFTFGMFTFSQGCPFKFKFKDPQYVVIQSGKQMTLEQSGLQQSMIMYEPLSGNIEFTAARQA